MEKNTPPRHAVTILLLRGLPFLIDAVFTPDIDGVFHAMLPRHDAVRFQAHYAAATLFDLRRSAAAAIDWRHMRHYAGYFSFTLR